ncbi:MAG: PPC domain-containing protein, partial [Chloroflexota bacterium]
PSPNPSLWAGDLIPPPAGEARRGQTPIPLIGGEPAAPAPAKAATVASPQASSCSDDSYEENDTEATAAALDYQDAVLLNLMICPSDEDWFEVVMAPDDVIDVDIYFEHINGDLDLELYYNGSLVDSSASTGDSEFVTIWNNTGVPITVQIKVFGFLGTVSNSYHHLFDVYPLTCPDDSHEPNETIDQLFSSFIFPGQYNDLAMCDGDDFYAFSVTEGQQITINLEFVHSQGDIDLYLHNPS